MKRGKPLCGLWWKRPWRWRRAEKSTKPNPRPLSKCRKSGRTCSRIKGNSPEISESVQKTWLTFGNVFRKSVLIFEYRNKKGRKYGILYTVIGAEQKVRFPLIILSTPCLLSYRAGSYLLKQIASCSFYPKKIPGCF